MSRTIHISIPRSLTVAGILTAAALGAPSASHAQVGDGERALLNHVPPFQLLLAISTRWWRSLSLRRRSPVPAR
jgi:hypothetical protein